MGLMYLFPTEIDDKNDDRVIIKNDKIILKTYGLPMIFWGYLAAILSVVAIMALISRSIILKMLSYNDPGLTFLAYLVNGTFILGPIILLAFYFYEKYIIKSNLKLTIVHKIFFIPIFIKNISLEQKDDFVVEHFLESPNIAKMKQDANLKGFENKGYFELKAISKGKKFFIDRHSRKVDLVKIKEILSKF